MSRYLVALVFGSLFTSEALAYCTRSGPDYCDSDPSTSAPDCATAQAAADRAYQQCLAREEAARRAEAQRSAEAAAARAAEEALRAARDAGSSPSNGDDPSVYDGE